MFTLIEREQWGKQTNLRLLNRWLRNAVYRFEKHGDIVATILDTMSDALGRGESIELRGFGTFKIKQYKPYTARNPRTLEKVSVKPKKLPVFTVGKALKEAVNANQKRN